MTKSCLGKRALCFQSIWTNTRAGNMMHLFRTRSQHSTQVFLPWATPLSSWRRSFEAEVCATFSLSAPAFSPSFPAVPALSPLSFHVYWKFNQVSVTHFPRRAHHSPLDPLSPHHGLEGVCLCIVDHEATGQRLLGRDLQEVGEVALLVQLHVVRAGDELGHRPQVRAAILSKFSDSL